MANKVEFYRHSLGADEADEVEQTLGGVFLTAGPRTKQFEEWLASYLGVKGAVGLFSCTTALFLAQKALDIGEGDEVITTPMTFIATSNTVLHTGAKLVFVDCEARTANIDLDQVEAAITPRTKAIMPVHLYGHMVDMRRLRAMADKHNLKIIEDCAHCIEGERDGVKPGQLGDVACFSFYATKNMASGEGGAVAGNDQKLLDRVRNLRTHGMNKEAANRYTDSFQHCGVVARRHPSEHRGNSMRVEQVPARDLRPHFQGHLARTVCGADPGLGDLDKAAAHRDPGHLGAVTHRAAVGVV